MKNAIIPPVRWCYEFTENFAGPVPGDKVIAFLPDLQYHASTLPEVISAGRGKDG